MTEPQSKEVTRIPYGDVKVTGCEDEGKLLVEPLSGENIVPCCVDGYECEALSGVKNGHYRATLILEECNDA